MKKNDIIDYAIEYVLTPIALWIILIGLSIFFPIVWAVFLYQEEQQQREYEQRRQENELSNK